MTDASLVCATRPPKGQADMIVAVLLRQPRRAVGCPAERLQEAELVGCALRVGAEQRQCADAVVGHAALSSPRQSAVVSR